jgi:twitching motility protein PilU
VEVLINTPLVSDHIRKGEVHMLKELMTNSGELGMRTFDQALYGLYSAGEVTYEAALAHADSANDLRLMIKLGADAAPDPMAKVDGLSMESDDDSAIPFRR